MTHLVKSLALCQRNVQSVFSFIFQNSSGENLNYYGQHMSHHSELNQMSHRRSLSDDEDDDEDGDHGGIHYSPSREQNDYSMNHHHESSDREYRREYHHVGDGSRGDESYQIVPERSVQGHSSGNNSPVYHHDDSHLHDRLGL